MLYISLFWHFHFFILTSSLKNNTVFVLLSFFSNCEEGEEVINSLTIGVYEPKVRALVCGFHSKLFFQSCCLVLRKELWQETWIATSKLAVRNHFASSLRCTSSIKFLPKCNRDLTLTDMRKCLCYYPTTSVLFGLYRPRKSQRGDSIDETSVKNTLHH